MKHTVISVLCLLAGFFTANAQFFLSGSDPCRTRWMEMTTGNYRLVYPENIDSLARLYAESMERWRPKVAATIGYLPNQNYRKPMPVILHPFSIIANGSVAWSPRRAELFTTPDFYSSQPLPWIDQLASHESRHIAQMQFGAGWKLGKVLLGEFWPSAMCAVFPGQAFLEGDAVVAETELSKSGRGRTASFLEYYRVCFNEGDWRDFWKWRYGSAKIYTPDYYRAGYISHAGARYLQDTPYFSRDYFRSITKKKLCFNNFQRSIKGSSGLSFKEAFKKTEELFQHNWEQNDALRAPFTEAEQLTKADNYSSYSGLTVVGEMIYAIKSSYEEPTELVRIDKYGKEYFIGTFASTADKLCYSSPLARLFWSERITDPRWELDSENLIYYMKADGRKHRLTRHGRYFNPAVSPDGLRLSVTSLSINGRTSIAVLSAEDGSVLSSIPAPDSLQICESAWAGEDIIVTAVSAGGNGIYNASRGFKAILPPVRTTVSDLQANACGEEIRFCSDRDGSEQLYSLSLDSLKPIQLTSTRFGAGCFRPTEGASAFYCTAPTRHGRQIFRIQDNDLSARKADFRDIWEDPVAARLSEQAKEALKVVDPAKASAFPASECDTFKFKIKHYSKAAHLFKFHSWAPVYLAYDAISSLSMEDLGTAAGVGATAFFQNDLNTMSGYAGARFWTADGGWAPGARVQFTYSGLYPVFEFTLDGQGAFGNDPSAVKGLVASLRSYVPFNLSSGGWSRGIIPSVSGNILRAHAGNVSKTAGTVELDLRAYTMRPKAHAAIWPRLGIGGEIQYIKAYSLSYSNSLKAFIYGYAPGLMPTHSIKLTALGYRLDNYYETNLGVNYAFPFAFVDWSALCPVTYVRNFECQIHAAYISTRKDNISNSTAGFGTTLNAVLGNIAWLPFTSRLGVKAMYYPAREKKFTVGAMLSVEL